MSAQHWCVSIEHTRLIVRASTGGLAPNAVSAHAHACRQEELGRRLGEFRAHVAELKAMDNTNELQKRKVRRGDRRGSIDR